MRPIEIAARVVLSVLFFYLGTKIGELRSKSERDVHCTASSSAPQAVLLPESDGITDCPPLQQTQLSLSPSTPRHTTQTCKHPYDTRKNLSVLHLGKATVPEDVFSFLHHPGTPAKWNYFFTQDRNWESDNILGECTIASAQLLELYCMGDLLVY